MTNWSGIASGAGSGAAAGSQVSPGWGTLIGGVLGGVMGAMGGDPEANARKYQQWREDYLRKQEEEAQQFRDEQRSLYAPIEQKLASEAASDEPLFYGQSKGNIEGMYSGLGRKIQESMASRGMSGSGSHAAATTGAALAKQSALGSAFERGLQARMALGQQLLGRYNPMANLQAVSRADTNLSNMYGAQADAAAKDSAEQTTSAAQTWGKLIPELANYFSGDGMGSYETNTGVYNKMLAEPQQIPTAQAMDFGSILSRPSGATVGGVPSSMTVYGAPSNSASVPNQ